jgi:hypothetical protein
MACLFIHFEDKVLPSHRNRICFSNPCDIVHKAYARVIENTCLQYSLEKALWHSFYSLIFLFFIV